MNNLPFKLYPSHKYFMLSHWRTRGLIADNVDEIYNRYIQCSECDWCCAPFKSRRDRQMDHCHLTGEFRGILCKDCNNNAKDCDNISWCNTYNKYNVRIKRNRKDIFHKYFKTREEAQLVLKELKDDNWWLFPWHIPKFEFPKQSASRASGHL